MKTACVRCGFVAAFLGLLPMGYTASEPVNTAVAPSKLTIEEQWQQLQIARTPWNNAPLYAGKTDVEQKIAREQEAAGYIAAADRFKEFYTANPTSPHAGEAKRLEAMTLMYAAISGNNANEGRWQGLVAEIRRDKTLPEVDRFAAASLGDNLAVRRIKYKTKEENLAAYEQTARSLIAEFPAQRGGYESLLGVARSASAAKSQEIALALTKMPAPTDIKYAAASLAKRYALVGQSALPLITNSGAKLDLTSGSALVIYGWASWSNGSQALAKVLKEKAGAATLVGVCLDTDLSAAQAAGKDLPGVQIYDERGREGALAQALQLSDAGWVYLVDRTGIIRSVRAQEDLSQLQTL